MTESNSTKKPEVAEREFTLTLPSLDAAFEVVAALEANGDLSRPPRLIKVSNNATVATASPGEQREIHVILSTGSGHQLASAFFSEVLSPILIAFYGSEAVSETRIHTTQSATSILELTNEFVFPTANTGKPLRIILASGDGGIVDLVNGLLAKAVGLEYVAPQVVLLPLGTANALYHSINVGKNHHWGLDALSSTSSKPLPVFTASFSPGTRLLVDEARKEQELPKDEHGTAVLYGAVVGSWGMHASLVADSDSAEYRKFGIDRFKMAAKEALYPADGSPPHFYTAKVSVLKGNEWSKIPEEEHMYVLATLVSNLEQPFCISPQTKPLDGSLHLVHFGPTSGNEAMRIMGLAYQGGKHADDPAVRYEAIDGLRIEFLGKEDDERWRRICVDGKIVRVESHGWVEIRKDERRVLDVVISS